MNELDREGFLVTSALVDPVLLADVERELSAPLSGAGSRNLLDQPWCSDLARTLKRHPILSRHLPADAIACQCTLFEKSLERNWLVSLHQDLSIAVKAFNDHPDWTGWSIKEGVHFAQPPESVLEGILAVRLHIDECGPEDGALLVVPGSHRYGRLDQAQALRLREVSGTVACSVPRGAALLMRPLSLHASSRASGNSRRRVLHFLFAPAALPNDMHWHWAI
jgi:hypothetical protein